MNIVLKRVIKFFKFFKIPIQKPLVLNIYPHHPPAFSQGLYYDGTFLYESTGLYGQSTLKKVDLSLKRIVKQIHLEEAFAEGIGCLNNRLVQLTWKAGTAYVYSMPDLISEGVLDYHGEGWGLTSKGDCFLMTDGSQHITYRDIDFQAIKSKKVTMNGIPLRWINDITFKKDSIYANVLYDNHIFEINEGSGKVLRVFDCTRLRDMAGQGHPEHVLNGIAYDGKSDTFFVTGKNWKYVFQVRLN